MKYFILIASLFFAAAAMAQPTGKITGRISGGAEKAVQNATINLLRAVDSVVVQQTLANSEGLYRFESVPEGRYRVKVTAVGYQQALSSIIQLSKDQPLVQVPELGLVPLNKDLAGVTITAKRPLIEQKIDRTIINVDALVSNAGVSALEVLENAPGVTVDKEGTISLKGKNGVIVLIDGRAVQMTGADLVNLLSSMNSSQVDQVEIMTNPPARYDASGTAGLINIKTKKALNRGYNGTANIAYIQGRYPKANESFSFNYRNEKINWFTNLGHNFNSGFGTLLIQRKIFNSATGAVDNYFDQEGHRVSDGNSFNGKMGLDYFINKKTTIGIVLNGTSGTSVSDQASMIRISNASKDLERLVTADVDHDNNWDNVGSNLNLRTLLNTKGRELTADLDFISYHSVNNQYMVNSYFDKGYNPMVKPDTLLGHLPQSIKLYSGRVDYIHPLQKGARLEAGLKSSRVTTGNDAVYDSIQGGRMVRDVNRSNHFVYEENIHAAYVNLQQPLSKKIGLQLGLRMEHTNADGRQLTTGVNFTRRYTQLFPTAYFQYKPNEKNTLMVNYGRRIRRPGYQSLNPFIKFIDRYTFSSGNPNLRPQLSDNVEISHSWRNMITTTMNYTHTSDIFDDVIEQKGEEAFKMPANIASFRQFGLAINAGTPITSWWTSNISINLFNNRYSGQVSGAPIALEATSFILNGVQQFKLNKTLTAEINGRYRNGWLEGVMRARPVGFIGAGLSQQLMKNKATLRVAVRDILFSQQFRGESRYGNVDFNFRDIKDTRQLTLAFSYRFSKGKKITPVKRTAGSANEEQERIDQ